jgi:ectoine hydroxylase-related dioxygenase (phytanoyl-CoA dioxygenase family)
MVVPGSHRTNRIDGPPSRDVPWPDPEAAIEVTADPGDAVFFDRRLWHARSDNHSTVTRKAVFFGYTYRWIAGRDEIPGGDLTPIQRQLLGRLGIHDGDNLWGHYPDQLPLHADLKSRGLLDPANPALRP